LAKYGGKVITEEELNQPEYNTTYVWSDANNVVNLARRGLKPLILDANPELDPSSWGAMINDGITIAANVTLMRFRNQVYIQLLEDGIAGMELYLEYGSDYWQQRYYNVNASMQQDLVTHYGIKVIPIEEC